MERFFAELTAEIVIDEIDILNEWREIEISLFKLEDGTWQCSHETPYETSIEEEEDFTLRATGRLLDDDSEPGMERVAMVCLTTLRMMNATICLLIFQSLGH